MKRLIVLLAVCATIVAGVVTFGGPTQAKAPGSNGRILFQRLEVEHVPPNEKTEVFRRYTYTANPDGSDVQQLTPSSLCAGPDARNQCSAESAHWSPDGSEVLVQSDICGKLNCAAFIVNPDTGVARTLPQPDPDLKMNCGFAWSPDGSLGCVVVNEDVGGDPSLDGIYTIRSSDGGGVRRVTDVIGFPGDFSPDGTRLVFQTFDDDDVGHLSVVNLDGTGLQQITPPDFAVNPGIGVSWSPDGGEVLFSGTFMDSGLRGALWTVKPNGKGMQEVPIPGCGGPASDLKAGLSCLRPAWSPDGMRIIFDARRDKRREVYTVNADGSGMTQITKSGLDDMDPDWGPHPLST